VSFMMLWILSFAVAANCVAALILSRYMLRRSEPVDRIIQGGVSVFAGIIALLSLFLPWVNQEESSVLGIDVSTVFTSAIRPFAMLLPVAGLLTVVGGLLCIAGYRPGKRVMTIFPLLGLSLSLALTFVIAFEILQQGNASLILDWGPLFYIYGSTIGVIAGKLERRP